MAFVSLTLAFLVVQGCFAMDYNADGNNKKRSFGIGKLRKGINFSSFSEFGKICAKYKVLPPAKYQIYLLFGEFDDVHDEKVQKIAITTDDKGKFKWNFNAMVVQNEEVSLKDTEKVTVLLCKGENSGCYIFREYDNYAEMKEQMAKTDNRFHEHFQVMYNNPEPSSDSEDILEDDLSSSRSEEEIIDEQPPSPNHQTKEQNDDPEQEEDDDDDDVSSENKEEH